MSTERHFRTPTTRCAAAEADGFMHLADGLPERPPYGRGYLCLVESFAAPGTLKWRFGSTQHPGGDDPLGAPIYVHRMNDSYDEFTLDVVYWKELPRMEASDAGQTLHPEG